MFALGCERRQLGQETSTLVKQLLWLVTAHPVLQDFEMLGVILHIINRHLVRVKRSLNLNAIDHFGSGPAFRGTQDDGGPPGNTIEAMSTGLFLILANFSITGI